MIKSEVVVKASLFGVRSMLSAKQWHLPADSMLCHSPICTVRSVPQIPGFNNVLPEGPGDFPLAIVVCGRRRRDRTPWQYLSGVCEYFRSPPLHLSVFIRRKTAYEGFTYPN